MDPLAPVGATLQERFALMLHDRLVDIERELRQLRPQAMDARVTLLGSRTRSDGGAVFVRLHSPWNAEPKRLATKVLEGLGRTDAVGTYELWCCQHWSLGRELRPYIIELVVERSPGGLDVSKVAHAALDAMDDIVAPLNLKASMAAEACALTCSRWFARSIKEACAGAGLFPGPYVLHPDTRRVDYEQEDDQQDPADPAEVAWDMLHGWMAHQVEATDLWHPRAMSAADQAHKLVTALEKLLLD